MTEVEIWMIQCLSPSSSFFFSFLILLFSSPSSFSVPEVENVQCSIKCIEIEKQYRIRHCRQRVFVMCLWTFLVLIKIETYRSLIERFSLFLFYIVYSSLFHSFAVVLLLFLLLFILIFIFIHFFSLLNFKTSAI